MTGLRRALAAIAVIAVACLWPLTSSAEIARSPALTLTETLTVQLNEGQLIRLDSPANSVFIANPEVADVTVRSTKLIYVFGKAPGRTTLYAVDKNDNVILNRSIVVKHNLGGLADGLATLLPSRGVNVESIEGGIILSGSVATATEAENARRLATRYIGEGEEIINLLAVTQPNQVNLRVKIAEVSRRAIEELGLNLDIFQGDFRFISGDSFLGFGGSDSTFGFGGIFGGTLGALGLDATFEALEEMGMSKTLAEPNLTALSGETASFLAGGEFPIPVARDEDTITIEFKEFGISLAFTPTIIGETRISLRVRPEVSQLSENGAITIAGLALPALKVRRADTTIELASGQSFAIAGLVQEDFKNTIRQVPLLGDIPILGALFRSEEFQRNETELVIVVTPYVVRPVAADSIPLPTDAYRSEKPARVAPNISTLSGTVPVPATASSAAARTSPPGYLLD